MLTLARKSLAAGADALRGSQLAMAEFGREGGKLLANGAKLVEDLVVMRVRRWVCCIATLIESARQKLWSPVPIYAPSRVGPTLLQSWRGLRVRA